MTDRDGMKEWCKEEWKSEASAGEILNKCGQRCDGGVSIPQSQQIIQLMNASK